MTDKDLRKHSKIVVDGIEQAPSRAMLRAVGCDDEDFAKPQIGICSTWSMVTPCNMHIDKLAKHVNKGTDDAGGKGINYNAITISDRPQQASRYKGGCWAVIQTPTRV